MIEMRRILCPIDFSDHSRRALDHAVAIARWYQAAVTVLHVFSPVTVAAVGAAPVVFEPMVLAPVGRDRLLADTKAFAAAESAPGVAIEAVVREGSTAAEILDAGGEYEGRSACHRHAWAVRTRATVCRLSRGNGTTKVQLPGR